MSQWIENDARAKIERSQPCGRSRLIFHFHLIRRLASLHRMLISGRGSVVEFDCFGDLTKALTFSPQREACIAECRVSEHVGLIHAFDVGHDFGP